jgi:hypothetical protein
VNRTIQLPRGDHRSTWEVTRDEPTREMRLTETSEKQSEPAPTTGLQIAVHFVNGIKATD